MCLLRPISFAMLCHKIFVRPENPAESFIDHHNEGVHSPHTWLFHSSWVSLPCKSPARAMPRCTRARTHAVCRLRRNRPSPVQHTSVTIHESVDYPTLAMRYSGLPATRAAERAHRALRVVRSPRRVRPPPPIHCQPYHYSQHRRAEWMHQLMR